MAHGPVRKFEIGPVVRALGGDVGNHRSGKQKIRCINPNHNDTRPSAQVDFSNNRYACFACELFGDAIDLIRTLEGASFAAAIERCEGIAGAAPAEIRPGPEPAPTLFGRSRTGR